MKSKLNIFRRLVQIIGLVIGFWGVLCITVGRWVFPGLHCQYCPISPWGCPIGMGQQALANKDLVPGAVTAEGAAVSIPPIGYILAGIVAYGIALGRTWCGWLCPFGTLNDITGYVGGGKKVSRVKSMQLALIPIILFSLFFVVAGLRWNPKYSFIHNFFNEQRTIYTAATLGFFVVITGLAIWLYKKRSLTTIKYAILLAVIVLSAVFGQAYFCNICPVNSSEAAIPGIVQNNTSPLKLAQYVYVFAFSLTLLGMLLVMRFWCRYLCPFGAVLALFNRASLLQLKHDSNVCGFCKAECSQNCPMGILVVKKNELTSDSAGDCTRCGECVRHCPNDALNFRFGWPLKRKAVESQPDVEPEPVNSKPNQEDEKKTDAD